MTVWHIILIASIAVLALKLAGFTIPAVWAEKPTVARLANLLTVSLLAALIVVQSFGSARGFDVDARLPAVAVAAVLFALRVPFIVVIIAAALVAAGIRALI
ncbi:AzlD domain-containing protein [Salinibacterium sp. UTAS2018]|uniref:AzlD domain-containing protein n=1 Tax=unclassified Salinibacterium TaxID=2632331 RepID=UPI0010098153|nr:MULTISPECIES: AzlD domain-containing protein [unclassified Salinibacterium]MBH0009178.1 AzlD domain-containing protein [Salinibacterium sp. SWN1162]QAV69595.1 AzlD domain-containing protein [Salinibacterium sp. UTAS2018]